MVICQIGITKTIKHCVNLLLMDPKHLINKAILSLSENYIYHLGDNQF